jgi:hypothetical protein
MESLDIFAHATWLSGWWANKVINIFMYPVHELCIIHSFHTSTYVSDVTYLSTRRYGRTIYTVMSSEKNSLCLHFYCMGAGIAQSVYRQATCWMAGLRFPAWERDFSPLHSVQTGSGAHSASYAVDSGGFVSWGRATGAWSWPLTCI